MWRWREGRVGRFQVKSKNPATKTGKELEAEESQIVGSGTIIF